MPINIILELNNWKLTVINKCIDTSQKMVCWNSNSDSTTEENNDSNSSDKIQDTFIEFESFKIIDFFDEQPTDKNEIVSNSIQNLEENSEFKCHYSKMLHEMIKLRAGRAAEQYRELPKFESLFEKPVRSHTESQMNQIEYLLKVQDSEGDKGILSEEIDPTYSNNICLRTTPKLEKKDIYYDEIGNSQTQMGFKNILGRSSCRDDDSENDIVDVNDECTINGDFDQHHNLFNSAISTNNSSNCDIPPKVFKITKKRESKQFLKQKVVIFSIKISLIDYNNFIILFRDFNKRKERFTNKEIAIPSYIDKSNHMILNNSLIFYPNNEAIETKLNSIQDCFSDSSKILENKNIIQQAIVDLIELKIQKFIKKCDIVPPSIAWRKRFGTFTIDTEIDFSKQTIEESQPEGLYYFNPDIRLIHLLK